MALFKHRRRAQIWHESSRTLRVAMAVVFGINALSDGALAQTADSALSPRSEGDCAQQLIERPIQVAMLPLNKLEPGAGPTGSSKAAAILGGTPSKLEQMRMAQAMGDMPAPTLINAAPVSAPNDQAAANCAARIIPATSAVAPGPAFLVPDNVILGAMSVAIKHTPFDRDWAAASAKQSSRKMQRALTATGARNSSDPAAQVEAINRWVNRKIEYGEDRDVYGRPDYWAPASETLRRGIGDCEDFAIAKMELLSALGVSRNKMRLVVARDLVRNADHAVLVVSLAGGAVMLDNATDHLLDARQPNDYRPIMSFSQNAKWVHGYAIQPAPPIRMAVRDSVPQPAAPELLDVQTVTREPDMPTISLALLSVPLALPTSL